MKNMTNLLILMVLTLSLSCSEKDSPSIDVENNLASDTTNTDDSSSVNDDTLCMYQNIILDTNDLLSTAQNDLIGKWKLISYADLSNCTFITKPDNIEKSVEIEFKDSVNVGGKTLGNEFTGKYKLQNDTIQFSELQMSLVQEPEWGEKLTQAIYNTDLITIKHDTLVIYYSQSKNAMIFSKP